MALTMIQANSNSATVYDPGVVFWLPPYSGLPGDTSENGHPHALVVRAPPGGSGTLAYGSTQATEAGGGAERHSVNPRPSRNPNGLSKLTHFYPGVLALREYAELPKRAGYLGKDLEGLREKLRLALGIGEGCTGQNGHTASSWRGRIVTLTAEAQGVLGTPVALIVTAPRYSKARSYQVVVPIYDGTGRAAQESVVMITEGEWLLRLGDSVTSALLVVPSTVSVWHKRHIVEDDVPMALDAPTMRHVDRSLCNFFELAPADE